MNVLFVSAEVTPFSKAGGLADVAGSLPTALSQYVTTIHVITPLYGLIDQKRHHISTAGINGTVILDDETIPYSIYTADGTSSDIPTWFVENDRFFSRSGIYTHEDGKGFIDNNLRFFFFQLVVLDLLENQKLFQIDILHCNDHHTGLLPSLVKRSHITCTSIFTIHNFLYQGHFSRSEATLLPLALNKTLTATAWDNFSTLLEGVDHAEIVTTVSPGYAQELLDGVNLDNDSHKHILAASDRLFGIVNGIDTKYWDPELDTYTPFHFSFTDISGKQRNKLELLKRIGLDQDVDGPLMGSISRLVENKGFPLILELLDHFVQLGAKFIFLGSGDSEITQALTEASIRHPGRIAFENGFNEPLAHLIEAGSDMFLMPSRFEPCGLNQLYSLRYGTVPIVHRTGGLGDTVDQWTENDGTGFLFETYTSDCLKKTVEKALDVFQDPVEWHALVGRAMIQDFSWNRSAMKYFELYTNMKARLR